MTGSSKRKIGGQENDAINKKKKLEPSKPCNLLQDNSVFGDILLEAGAVLRSNGSSVELTKEQSLFQRSLVKLIKCHPDYPQVIDEFAEKLSSQIENPVRLHAMLTPTLVLSGGDEHQSSGMHDSLIRILLGIEILQPSVAGLLLERMVEFVEHDGQGQGSSTEECLPKLIMNQFRWLDRIVNPKDLVDKMFEVTSITPLEIQREIISCLPEIIDDIQHSDVARILKDMLSSNRHLMPTILDVLTNLNLSQELLSEVREAIIETVPSVELDDLPVIIRFLLQTVSAVDAFQVVSDIRSQLDLTVIVPMSKSSHPGSSKRNEGNQGSIALILEAIQSGVRFQKFVAEAWLKVIESIKQSTDHKVVDILVFLILYSCGYRKQVESLSRSRIISGHFTEALLQQTFNAHGQVLREYFASVLVWAEVLLRSQQPIISRFACAIYTQAFIAFDTYCQQEIIGNLVTHIGSGIPVEIESSLNILLDLVSFHNRKMAPFAIFIKGVLDYIDNLSMSQIRKLYRMLGCLAFGHGMQDSVIQDSLHMIIRKQLSNTNSRYQQMGVLGTVAVIMNIARRNNKSDDEVQGNCSSAASEAANESLPDDLYQQTISLLQLAKTSCGRSPDSLALFMEELAVIVCQGNVHSKVEEWIAENVINDFQDDFVIDISPEEKEGSDPIPWTLNFGLDSEADGSIAINLLPLVPPSRQLAAGKTGTEKQNTAIRSVSVWWLASNFRLLQICESRMHKGDLDGIDALLGCPIKIPRLDIVTNKIESMTVKEKHIVCDCFFLTINWFREVINAFSCQSDSDIKAKVVSRLKSMLELQQLLESCLKGLTDYIPPPAVFDSPTGKPIAISGPKKNSAKGKTKKKKGRKNGKKAKEDDGDEDEDSSDDESREEAQVDKESNISDELSVVSTCTVNTKALNPFLRELDFDVLSLLNVSLSANPDNSVEGKMRQDTKKVFLEPLQLMFLLDDLVTKLDHALISHETKKVFFKIKEEKLIGFSHLDDMSATKVMEKTVDLLPSLCQHIESTTTFFQALIAADDGLIDGPRSRNACNSVLASCQKLLLQSLLSFFSWNGFLQSSNAALQLKAFGILAGRICAGGTATQPSLSNLVRLSYTYLENLSGSVPTLSVSVMLCRLLSFLAEKSDLTELKDKTGDLVLSYLKREWLGTDGTAEKGSIHNENLQTLLQLYFQSTEEVQATLESLASTAIPELIQADRNGGSTTFPTLTRHSYAVFYRVMLHELLNHVKSIQPGRQTDPQQENIDKLLTWSVSVRIFHILVSLVKTFDARSNLSAILKFGRLFLEAFLRSCMPMLDHMFRGHRDDIQSLLKNLQLSTRALHHMCGHSKIMKDIQLTNQVPQLKRTLEVFVYRVKAMLKINNCLEAFWLGNLKNRDLKGDEILSQSTNLDVSQPSSSGESLPEDEDSDKEEDVPKNSSKPRKSGLDSDDNINSDVEESYSEAY